MSKNKLPILYLLLIFSIPLTFLLWHGEETIKKHAVVGFSVLSFADSLDTVSLDEYSSLTLQIENMETKEVTYRVSTFLNKKPLEEKEVKVKSRDILLIDPGQKIFEESKQNQKNEYLVQIEWSKNKKSLRKQFRIENEKQ